MENLLSLPSRTEVFPKRGKWTPEEDASLSNSVERFGEKHWRLISEGVPGRTPIQCLHRWSKILKPGLVKGPWNTSEDKILLDWISRFGPRRWSQCANHIPGRNGKQCRERWHNTLCPNIKKGDWTGEEDKVIFDMYERIGGKWTEIAKQLPGRTENSIKNRFYSTARRNKLQEKFEEGDFLADFPQQREDCANASPSSEETVGKSTEPVVRVMALHSQA